MDGHGVHWAVGSFYVRSHLLPTSTLYQSCMDGAHSASELCRLLRGKTPDQSLPTYVHSKSIKKHPGRHHCLQTPPKKTKHNAEHSHIEEPKKVTLSCSSCPNGWLKTEACKGTIQFSSYLEVFWSF